MANYFSKTFSTLTAFILAMTTYPEAQKKAQAELDAVIGPDRLPTFEDRDSLPYVNALLKETTRWHPVLPLAIPHKTTEEDVYNGCYIPAGTVIIPNSWCVPRAFIEHLALIDWDCPGLCRATQSRTRTPLTSCPNAT